MDVRISPIPPMCESMTSPGERKRGGFPGQTDARGGAREDQVAGEQRSHAERRSISLPTGRIRSLVGGLLHRLAVHRAADLEVVGVVQLVGGHDPRAGRAEAGVGLAQAELGHRADHLQDALGQVLPDRQARDVGPAVGLGDPGGPGGR